MSRARKRSSARAQNWIQILSAAQNLALLGCYEAAGLLGPETGPTKETRGP